MTKGINAKYQFSLDKNKNKRNTVKSTMSLQWSSMRGAIESSRQRTQ